MKYRLNEPICGEIEKRLLNDVIESNYLGINGKYTQLFEQKFAKYHDMKYGLAVQSGTAAVHTALAALDIGPGDWVAVPAFTCSGSYTPILQLGATPIVIDVDPDTFGMDLDHLVKAHQMYHLNAIVIVHVYGQPARDMHSIRSFCRSNNIKIIEDCAEAHGAKISYNMPVGCMSDAATFSVRSEKLIGVGEGGIVLFNNKDYYKKGHWFANRCKGNESAGWDWKYYTDGVGCNYLMPHLLGAFAYGQVSRLQGQIARRKEIGLLYRRRLPQFDWQKQNQIKASFWLNYLRFPINVALDRVVSNKIKWIGDDLMKAGVEIRPGFWPVHRQPLPGILLCKSNEDIWEADRITYTGLCLPSHQKLTDNDVLDICKLVEDSWNKYTPNL